MKKTFKNKIVFLFMMLFMLLFSIDLYNGGRTVMPPDIIDMSKKEINVFVTTYKYSKERCTTADGSIIRPGVFWCAVSPDLLRDNDLNFGDTIIYKDIGYAIHDLTHERLRGTVDILIHDNNVFSESNKIYINNSPHD